MNDDMIFEAMAEEAAEREPERPGGMTPEAEIIAQSKDPAEFTELEWEIVNPSSGNGKGWHECELGSCEKPITHYLTLLSWRTFFGCEEHVDELVKLKVTRKAKQKLDSDGSATKTELGEAIGKALYDASMDWADSRTPQWEQLANKAEWIRKAEKVVDAYNEER